MALARRQSSDAKQRAPVNTGRGVGASSDWVGARGYWAGPLYIAAGTVTWVPHCQSVPKLL
jgi:hypothetical protein